MIAIYADDAQELLPGLAPIVGREAIRKFYAEVLAQLPHCAYAFEAHDTIVAESADLAVVRGAYRFTPDERWPENSQTGKFIGIWRRQDDDWRLLLNMSNA